MINEYQKLKEKLYSLHSKDAKNRLENIKIASTFFKNPHVNFKSIHVAGTNGKGSVATKIAKTLSLSGYKTALYTSPHISSYEERFSIDGKLISKKKVQALLKEIFSIQKKLNIYLSFFDITTLLAFIYFSNEKVDFAVIETGLGGRLDATNIITPILSIITSISLDHTNILGNTIDLIAEEKAGIIKLNVPTVIGNKANLNPILQKAQNLSSSLYISKAPNKKSFYDDENSLIAKKALEILNNIYPIKKIAIKNGLKVRPNARFEIFKNFGPKAVILDVAHNEDGFKELKKAIKKFYPNEKVRIITGFSKQKDTLGCLKIIKTFSNFIHVIEAKSFKALSKFEIEKDLIKLNFSKYKIESNIKDAAISAKKLAIKNKEILLVCGSFYILEEIKKAIL